MALLRVEPQPTMSWAVLKPSESRRCTLNKALNGGPGPEQTCRQFKQCETKCPNPSQDGFAGGLLGVATQPRFAAIGFSTKTEKIRWVLFQNFVIMFMTGWTSSCTTNIQRFESLL